MSSAVHLRPASGDDAQRLFAWRNDSATRAASRNQGEVGWQEHRAWLARTLADPDRTLLIAIADDEPIGQVRLDMLVPGEFEVSVSLDPAARGRGFGAALIQAGLDWVAEREPQAVVIAEIRPENEPSLRAFTRTGFTPAGERGEMLRFQRPAASAASD